MATKKEEAKKGEEETGFPAFQDNNLYHLVNEQAAEDVFFMLFIFRCVNAVNLKTFFQPDEYFQALEPAWQMAFGPDSGAWITWEWHHQLRSSLHPALFAIFYYVVDKAMDFVGMFPQFRSSVLTFLPGSIQALISALGNYYTWQFAERMYGTGSNTAWAALFLSVASPWEWFCSTRTFSNSLETSITIIALYYWPWKLTSDTFLGTGSSASHRAAPKSSQANPVQTSETSALQTSRSVKHLRISLLLAATAVILRPTNALIWFCIAMPTLTRLFAKSSKGISPDLITLVRESVICSSIILLVSAVSDRFYYGEWTFPHYQTINFNIGKDIAVFYGRNDWHYYLTQGLPLLLTTALPFTLVAIYKSSSLPATDIRFLFATTVLVTVNTLSLISHKEVRFIYPLLPLLHILTAPVLSQFFTKTLPPLDPPTSAPKGVIVPPMPRTKILKKPLLALMLLLNILIAGYTTLIHQSGVRSVQTYIRKEYELLALDTRGLPLASPLSGTHDPFPKTSDYTPDEIFVAYLMPCHSTPWRSSLFYPGLKAWALTCEPPLSIPPHTPEREAYRDEADRFYDNPIKFLKEEVGGRERPWPRFVVGFEGIEGVLKEYYEKEMPGFLVREKWRTRNSHWIDDERRKGDVVVWEFVEDK